MIGTGRFDPAGAALADLPFPEYRFGLQTIHQIVGSIKCCTAANRRGAGKDDGFTRWDRAASMDHPDMANIEALSAGDSNLLQGLASERRVVLENQSIDGLAIFRLRPRQANEAHDGPIATRAFSQFRKLELRIEHVGLEERNHAHPPETGGRNSTLSFVVTR